MSMRIEVRRVRNTLSYLPKYYVDQLADGVCIISICDEDERRPVWLPNQKVLELTTGLNGLNGADFKKACEFLAEHHGQNIYVHCYMGQVRSKGLCQNLAIRNPGYQVLRHSTNCVIHSQYKD